jgi:hypothetical protein
MINLVPLIERYGEDIEFDLLVLGIDILSFFRGEQSWRRFMVLVNRLPTTSHFVAAQKRDPETADKILAEQEEADAAGRPRPLWRPLITEWSNTDELLALQADRIGELEAMIQNLPFVLRGKKGKAKPPKRYARPETALEQAEFRRRLRYFESVDEDVQEAQERYRQQQAGTAS